MIFVLFKQKILTAFLYFLLGVQILYTTKGGISTIIRICLCSKIKLYSKLCILYRKVSEKAGIPLRSRSWVAESSNDKSSSPQRRRHVWYHRTSGTISQSRRLFLLCAQTHSLRALPLPVLPKDYLPNVRWKTEREKMSSEELQTLRHAGGIGGDHNLKACGNPCSE